MARSVINKTHNVNFIYYSKHELGNIYIYIPHPSEQFQHLI